MKKMTKFGKTVLLSTLAALAFGGVAVGTTYALFTSDAKTDVTVQTGKVLVEKTVSLEGGETLVDGEVTSVTASSGVITFGCNGTATIDANGNVDLNNIVAGDKVTVKVHAANKSNVNIKYRAIVTTTGDFADIVKLEGKANGVTMKNSATGLFTKFADATVGTDDLGDYELTFGIDKDTAITDGTTKSGKVTIKIEAIQGNAKVTDESEYFAVDDAASLVETVSSAEAGSTVEIKSDVELEDTLTVNKDLNIILDSDVTAPSGKSAIVVGSGSVVTIDGTSTTTTTPSGRVKAANRTVAPKITSDDDTAIIVSGGKAIINNVDVISGYGAVAVEDEGELVIDGGSFTGVEFAAMAFSNSKLTINGGTFEATDNFVIGTNGSTGLGGNVITINGGTFNGYIESVGYIGCGVYVANSDTVNIKAGTFNIENGCGILARSGKTTVADDVVFNFTNTKGGITEGGVGDKSTKVPVNARIVKDLSKETYPGGVPVVTGKCGVDVINTTGKTYLVSDESELTAALADTANSTKYIYLTDDIDLTGRLTVSTKDTVIYGDGSTKLVVTASGNQNRVFNLDGEDYAALTGGSFSLVGIDAKTADTVNESRGISTYQLTNFKVTLDTASLAAKYPFSIGDNSKSVEVVARNVASIGYSAFQVSGISDFNIAFEDSTLTGTNIYEKSDDNNYGAIVVEKGVENAVLSFKNCKILASNEPNYNIENFFLAKASSTGSVTFDEDCTFTFNGSASTLDSYISVLSNDFKVL